MKRGAFALVVVAGALSGCAPALLWYGHDPARATRWELRQKDGQAWLEADAGRHTETYDEIAVADLTFAPDGARFAVPARRGTRWTMIVDLRDGLVWDAVSAARFSPDGRHVAYTAGRGDRWFVVLDGVPGPAVDAVVAGTLAFGPSGRRLGYAAADGSCVRVMSPGEPPAGCHGKVRALFVGDTSGGDRVLVDDHQTAALVQGTQVLPLAGLSTWAFDARNGRWAAVTRTGGRAQLAVDGAPLDEADEITHLTFSPTGQVSRAVRNAGDWRFALNERRDGAWQWLGPAVFSATGRRYGYVAGAPDGRAAVVIDGGARGLWSGAAGLTFSTDDRRAAYVVRSGPQTAIVVDDRLYPFDVVIENSITFSTDNRHWAAVVGDRRRRRLSIVVDGQRHLPFDSQELFGAASVGISEAGNLRAWVVAELERDLRRPVP